MDIDKKQQVAAQLVLKSLQTGKSSYANEAIKIGNLKDAYAKLGIYDRIIMNLGRQDLQAQNKPSDDPATLYRAGQTYLFEYFNRELIETRTRRTELELKQKPLFKNIDLAGKLFGPQYAQGPRDWTADEAQVLFNAKYQLGILALSQNQAKDGGGIDASKLPETVKIAKEHVEKVRLEIGKNLIKPGQKLDPKTEEKIWQETVRRFNDRSDPSFRSDWVLWYNYQQAIVNLPPNGEDVLKQISQFPATGFAARGLRLVFPNFATGAEYLTPPTSGVTAKEITPEAQAAQAEQQRAIELGRKAAGLQ
jgi:hypothetical protein